MKIKSERIGDRSPLSGHSISFTHFIIVIVVRKVGWSGKISVGHIVYAKFSIYPLPFSPHNALVRYYCHAYFIDEKAEVLREYVIRTQPQCLTLFLCYCIYPPIHLYTDFTLPEYS